jgi:hypothetical protein
MNDQLPATLPASVSSIANPRALVPTTLEGVWKLAQIVAASGIAPKDMNTAEKVSIAIMHGLEVGLTPMAALQSICVINGRPSIWGDGALALVQASGQLEEIREFEETREGTKTAVCSVKRKGWPNVVERTFSEKDAALANLAGKDIHKLYPARMRQMRARAFALRDTFADVFRGLAFAEEMQDVVAAEVTPPPAKRSKKNKETPAEATAIGSAEVQGSGAVQVPPTQAPESTPDPFDEHEFINDYREHCSYARSLHELQDVDALFADDWDKLSKAGRTTIDVIKEKSEARIKEQIAKEASGKPKDADPPQEASTPEEREEGRQRVAAAGGKGTAEYLEEDRKDDTLAQTIEKSMEGDSLDDASAQQADDDLAPPAAKRTNYFAIPEKFDDPIDYRMWVSAMVGSVHSQEQAAKLRKNYQLTKEIRNKFFTRAEKSELQGPVQETLDKWGA